MDEEEILEENEELVDEQVENTEDEEEQVEDSSSTVKHPADNEESEDFRKSKIEESFKEDPLPNVEHKRKPRKTPKHKYIEEEDDDETEPTMEEQAYNETHDESGQLKPKDDDDFVSKESLQKLGYLDEASHDLSMMKTIFKDKRYKYPFMFRHTVPNDLEKVQSKIDKLRYKYQRKKLQGKSFSEKDDEDMLLAYFSNRLDRINKHEEL